MSDPLVEVVAHDGPTRVLRLDLDSLPIDVSAGDWQVQLRANGVHRGAGAIALVVHGWSATSGGLANAARHVAAIHDRHGISNATVIAVDWPAMKGASLATIGLAVADHVSWLSPWLDALAPDVMNVSEDFAQAEANAILTGDILATVLTGLAALDFDAPVIVQAHSLGNHVAMRAITGLDDPTGRFAVGYTAIQPAVPDTVGDDPAYGGVLTGRVAHLTVTINNADVALLAYDAQGPHPLGLESLTGARIAALVSARSGQHLATDVVSHHSRDGNGHLAIDPANSPLVHVLANEGCQRLTGRGTQYADARRILFDAFGPWGGDQGLHAPSVLAYIEDQRLRGEPIDPVRLTTTAKAYQPPGTRGLPPVTIIRPATADDAPLLQEMLAVAADWRPGAHVRSVAEIMSDPALAQYVAGWPKDSDAGFVADAEVPLGAVWWRFFTEQDRGYGFVDEETPELAIGVVPNARGRGVGTLLLRVLIDEARRRALPALSLSVEPDNPAAALYRRLGFETVSHAGDSHTMLLQMD